MSPKKNFKAFYIPALVFLFFAAFYLSARPLSDFIKMISGESALFIASAVHIFMVLAAVSMTAGFLYLFFDQMEKTRAESAKRKNSD